MKFMNDKWQYSQLRAPEGEGEGGTGGEGDGDGAGEGDADGTGDGDAGNTGDGDAGDGDGGEGDAGGDTSFYSAIPDDWREQVAGEDEAFKNDLKRYTSFDKWVESGWNAKQNIRKGETSTGLPDEPSDEQMAAYREANDIPAGFADYKIELDGGMELSEMDMEVMETVQKVAHEQNMSNETLSAITNVHLQAREAQLQQLEAQDGLDHQATEKIMRDNWGGNYDTNMGSVLSMLGRLPEDIRDEVIMGRTASGKGLMNTPEFVQMLADVALEVNPMANIPGGADNMDGTADQIISKVKTIFAEGREATDYYKDEKLQKMYEQALAAKAKSN